MPIVTPFTGSADAIGPEYSRFVDGNTGKVTSYERLIEQIISAHPAEWSIHGASSSLLTRISAAGAGIITDIRALTVSYLANSCSPGDKYKGDTAGTAALAGTARPAGGVHYMQPILRCKRAKMRYALRFPMGFDWRGGGKLPGFSSMLWDASGGNTSVGGYTSFTARHMWRPNGQFTPYFYMGDNQAARWKNSHYTNASMPTVNWGTAAYSGSTLFSNPRFFTPGAWDVIESEIWLNDVGRYNGCARVTLNGMVVAERDDLVWRWNDSLWIDAVFMSSFFGGNTFSEGDASIWYTPTNQTVDFSDIVVTKIE